MIHDAGCMMPVTGYGIQGPGSRDERYRMQVYYGSGILHLPFWGVVKR